MEIKIRRNKTKKKKLGRPKGSGHKRVSLNLRQKRFVREYLKDMNGARAARDAGFSERGANVAANRLLKDERVQKALQKEMDRRTKRTEISQDKVLWDLEEARLAAFEDKQYSPAVKASELHGKHLAMFSDRLLHDATPEMIELAVDLPNHIAKAQAELMHSLKLLAGGGGEEAEEITVEEKVVNKRITIKRRKKKGGNGQKDGNGVLPVKAGERRRLEYKGRSYANKHLFSGDDADLTDPEDDYRVNADVSPDDRLSTPDWQPFGS